MSYQLVRGGTLLMLLPVSTIVLTGNKKGGWSPKNVLPVSTITKGWWYPLNFGSVGVVVPS